MSTTVQIRISDQLKKAARKAFHAAGLDLSSGIKLYLAQVANTGKVPFETFTYDNVSIAQKEAILKDAQDARQNGTPFATAREAIDDLLQK